MNPTDKFSSPMRWDEYDNTQIQELSGSPRSLRRSPPRYTLSPVSTSSIPVQSASSTPVLAGEQNSEDDDELKSETTDSDVTSKSGKISFRHSIADDIFNFVSRKRTTSSSSSTDGERTTLPKSPTSRNTSSSPGPISKAAKILYPSRSPQIPRKEDVDTRVATSAGHFFVAPKDMSVLERISRRIDDRSSRVRKPHEVFVELEELRLDMSDELEWEETARWIKFEEDVEEGSGRWGRPHVSALDFHSLVDLRKGLNEGLVLLDLEGDDFPTIAQEIVNTLVSSGQLPIEEKEPVLRILLKKHKHSNDITLWEKLRQSATDPEGRLHHIGEGLRLISHAHGLSELNSNGEPSSKHRESRRKSLPDITLREAKNSKEKDLGVQQHSGPTNKESFKRIASAPLIGDSAETTPSPSPMHGILLHEEANLRPHDQTNSTKKVVFKMGSSEELFPNGPQFLNPPSSQEESFESSEVSAATDSTLITDSSCMADTTIEIDYASSEEKCDDDKLESRDPPQRQISSSSLKRKASVLSLMNKIPDEAESLTVLVGGVKFLHKPLVAFIRLEQSHLLGDLTEVPVPLRFIYLLLGPENEMFDYHEVGRAMATLMSDSHFHDTAYSAVCKEDFLDAMDKFLEDSIVLPPGDWDEELLLPTMHERNECRRRRQRKVEEINQRRILEDGSLKHTKIPCGGFWNDFKKLVQRYPSDLRDALHIQVFISIFFLYIAFLAPAIAFGGLLEEITHTQMGVTEALLATGLSGIVYGIFSVQPISVLALTGPLLLFESVILEFAIDSSIPYIEWRAVTSLWLMLILVIAAISEISFLVKYFTRFSEEIFTGIVCLFFIVEASSSVYHIFERNPLCGLNYPCGKYAQKSNSCEKHLNSSSLANYSTNISDEEMSYAVSMMSMMDIDMSKGVSEGVDNETALALPVGFRICNQPNTALWSLILCMFTFFIALFLRKLRQGKFLGKQGRRLVSDFGMLTAIMLMVLLAWLLRDLIAVEVITVSRNYETSNVTRSWFINPFNGLLSVGQGFGAIIPAVLLSLLIFIENQLTILLINKPEHQLKKEVGYHLDLLIVALLTGVCGLLGIPWVCAATIRSVQHLQALSVFSSKNPPGEKPKLKHVYEQRVTTIVVHMLIILTPLAYPVLNLIPISVTLGVFFYLAYSSLSGVQLTKRLKLVITPPKHYPNILYVKKVRYWKMHVYTVIQMVCIGILFGLKNSAGGMLYPVVIVLLIPLKWILGKCLFSQVEMDALDSEEDDPEERVDGWGEGDVGEFQAHVPY